MPIIFEGDGRLAYRDPACYFHRGRYHLFFTLSVKEDGYMYNYVAHSVSKDLLSFSEPRIITVKDRTKNFCSPGCVIKRGAEFLIAVTSYPMPRPYLERPYADETARLYFISTKDFESFSEPRRIYPKGRVSFEEEGRMIDPFVLFDGGMYHLFFKQNGVSRSVSRDLEEWTYLGRAEGGENACVLKRDGKYLLIHSPENGIGIKESEDLAVWSDVGTYTLCQESWDFASGRLTAAFAMEAEPSSAYRYLVFFHGSRAEQPPETHGAASLALAFTNDFEHYVF